MGHHALAEQFQRSEKEHIFRAFHKIKGSISFYGEQKISQICNISLRDIIHTLLNIKHILQILQYLNN
jgi:chemotaxis protein histidine kinase CheA